MIINIMERGIILQYFFTIPYALRAMDVDIDKFIGFYSIPYALRAMKIGTAWLALLQYRMPSGQ